MLLSQSSLVGFLTRVVIAGVIAAGAVSGVSAQEAASRKLATAFGEITIKGEPKRVVVLNENALDTALALGVRPVGTLATRGGEGVANYLREPAGKIAIVGTARETNLESVLGLQPDLILASPGTTRDMYSKLSMLAPTVVPTGSSLDDWRTSVALYAAALGKQAVAVKQFEAIDKRAAALKQRLPANTRVSIVRWNPQGPVVMSSHLFAGQLLRQLGLSGTALADTLDKTPHSDILSLENMSKADGDWLFVATLNSQGDDTLAQARKQPAFVRLKAVQAGRVVTVDGQIWTGGSGILAAKVVLDDVEKALLAK